MPVALEEAVRSVLDHGRCCNGHIEVPTADFETLAGTYRANSGRPAQTTQEWRPAPRDPAYEREMLQLFANAELNP